MVPATFPDSEWINFYYRIDCKGPIRVCFPVSIFVLHLVGTGKGFYQVPVRVRCRANKQQHSDLLGS
jgi:hypothetical protein